MRVGGGAGGAGWRKTDGFGANRTKTADFPALLLRRKQQLESMCFCCRVDNCRVRSGVLVSCGVHGELKWIGRMHVTYLSDRSATPHEVLCAVAIRGRVQQGLRAPTNPLVPRARSFRIFRFALAAMQLPALVRNPGLAKKEEADFVDELVPPELICVACHHLLTEPLLLECGHCVCYVCWHHELAPKRLCVCPEPSCQQLIKAKSKTMLPDLEVATSIKKQLTELRIYCTHRTHGCAWQGLRAQLAGHIGADCDQVPCAYAALGCAWRGTTVGGLSHTMNCPHAPKKTDKISFAPFASLPVMPPAVAGAPATPAPSFSLAAPLPTAGLVGTASNAVPAAAAQSSAPTPSAPSFAAPMFRAPPPPTATPPPGQFTFGTTFGVTFGRTVTSTGTLYAPLPAEPTFSRRAARGPPRHARSLAFYTARRTRGNELRSEGAEASRQAREKGLRRRLRSQLPAAGRLAARAPRRRRATRRFQLG